MIKILHTGDIHLDSPFSRLDVKRAEARKNELRTAFVNMMSYARTNSVDVILIAGDLFDSEFVTRETVALIAREAANCRAEIFIVAGNHDPISETAVYLKEGIFSDNVHIFRKDALEKISVDRLGVDVYGYSFVTKYLRENPAEGKKVEDPDRFNILLGHADTRSPDSPYCPINEDLIKEFGADYTALGHIHNAPEPRLAGNCAWAFCGCLEGRDFGECGAKGALLVEAEKKGAKAEFNIKKLRFSKRRYECEELNVDGASSTVEILQMINGRIAERGYGVETLLSMTLRGRLPSTLVINPDVLAREVTGLFYFELADGTVPLENAEELGADATVRGQFFRELKSSIDSDDPVEKKLAEKALRYGLAALEGENIVDF
ncbi:MAG: DNA repair exonuclease [Clostridia bacterium]|nr:DNA repair exonuclease [Clostridia bacterium]